MFKLVGNPGTDSKYSGALEIPAGTLEAYEDVYDAITREVFEEAGLKVSRFKPDIRTKVHTNRGDQAYAFVPFCCQQETKGRTRVGFVFLCEVEDWELIPAEREVKDIRWMKRAELRKLMEEKPEEIFTFQLGALDYYFNYWEEQGRDN